MNLILGTLILTAIGMSYLWICVKERRRGEDITALLREITSLELQIHEKEGEMNTERTSKILKPRAARLVSGLIEIPNDKIIHVSSSILKSNQ